MTGADRLRWLNGLVTCNVETPLLEHYGLLCEKKGKIETDFHFVDHEGALYVALPVDKIDAIYTILDHHLIMEDVAIEQTALAVTWHFAEKNAGESSLDVNQRIGVKVPLRGLGEVTLLSGAMIISEAAVPGIGDELTDDEWSALRIASRVPAYGVDFDATMYPQEASIEKHAVAFDKGCYMGQEVVFMMQNRGHARRRLMHLELEGTHAIARDAEVKNAAGEAMGKVTSAAATSDTTYAIALLASKLVTKDGIVTIGAARGKITSAS